MTQALEQQLRAAAAREFGVELSALEEVGGGADTTARLWRGEALDGRRWAVKLIDRDGVRRLSLTPWVDGRRALDGGLDGAGWRAFGRLLRELHERPLTPELEAALPHERHDHGAWADLMRSVQRRLDVGERDDDPLVIELARAWASPTTPPAALIRRADALAAELRARPAQLVHCHGDPHLGNLVVDRDGALHLIDWDDELLAPRERDLLFAIGGVLAFAPVTDAEQGAFFDGYGAVAIERDRLAYHRCVRALEDLAEPAAQVLDAGRRSETERAEALATVREVLSATGLVRQALGG